MKKVLIVLGVLLGLFITISALPDKQPLKDSQEASTATAHNGPLHDKAAFGLMALSGGDIDWARTHLRFVGVTRQGAVCYTFKGGDGDYHDAYYGYVGADMVVGGAAKIGCKNATPINEAE